MFTFLSLSYVNKILNGTKINDELIVMKLTEDAITPTKGSKCAAGFDLYSIEESVILPWTRIIVQTGISIELPQDTYGRIAPRSGLSVKNSIDIGAGVIDSDYRGEIKVVMINNSNVNFKVTKEMRIAQLICEKISYPKIRVVESLSQTDRDNKGFGSTG